MNRLQMRRRIREERNRYEADEDLIHNKRLHKEIIKMWRRDAPATAARLDKEKMLDDVAFVSQQRMWRTMQMYLDGGMPVTDAREQAEREHLALTDDDPETPPEIPLPPTQLTA